MHAAGRDGLALLNFKEQGVQEHDVAVCAFGETDVRAHICKQRDQNGRDEDEIIATLVTNYLETIRLNCMEYDNNVYCIVVGVIPPTKSPGVHYFGPPKDHVRISKKLNKMLQNGCDRLGVGFLGVYDFFAGPDGFRKPGLTPDSVHIHMKHNRVVKEALAELILERCPLFFPLR